MSFVKLSIFGTSFEVSDLWPRGECVAVAKQGYLKLSQVTTRYVDLQPVGMG